MTRDRHIERVLDSWLSEGPMQMPSQVLDVVADRIASVPQRRIARINTGFFPMHLNLRLAAAAVILLVAAAAGGAFLTRAPGVGDAASPTLSPLPTQASPAPGTAQVVVDLASLRARWVSVGPREWPKPTPPASGHEVRTGDMTIDATTIVVSNYRGDISSSYSSLGGDSLSLVLGDPADWNCRAGDAGTYTISLAAAGATLTITPQQDACGDRAYLLAGEWGRTDVGSLAPGPHGSSIFKPFGVTGLFSYTIPAGWEVTQECASCYTLARDSDASSMINLVADVLPTDSRTACRVDSPAPPVVGTAAELASWLRTLPGLAVSAPKDVVIGSLSGVMVDLTLAPGSSSCPLGQGNGPGTTNSPPQGDEVVQTFTDAGTGSGLSLAVGTTARYALLDHGVGQTLLIDIESADQAGWDAYLADAMRILDSFLFVR